MSDFEFRDLKRNTMNEWVLIPGHSYTKAAENAAQLIDDMLAKGPREHLIQIRPVGDESDVRTYEVTFAESVVYDACESSSSAHEIEKAYFGRDVVR